MTISEFSIRNPIVGRMVTIAVLVAGYFALQHIPREAFPSTELDLVMVRAAYPGATPDKVERHVTSLVEAEIRAIEGIEEYSSVTREGLSTVVCELDPSTRSRGDTIDDIQRAMGSLADLPEDVDNPHVAVIEHRDEVVRILIHGSVSEKALRDYTDYLKTRVEGVDHVTRVLRDGWRERQIWVEVDPHALKKHEISLLQVLSRLRESNLSLPGGKVRAVTGDVLIRTEDAFAGVEDVRRVVIRSDIDGNEIRLTDLATVGESYDEDDVICRSNGERSIMLTVQKGAKGDLVTMSDEIVRLLTSERELAPEGIHLNYLDFHSYMVKRRLNVLIGNGVSGLLLVMIILPVMLNFRVALLTAFGIPFAFLTTLVAMELLGVSINMLTMFALIMVLGMIVDDAIIVAENIYRHMEAGVERKRAAILGANEVLWPVVTTIATTIAAFVPMMFLPGMMGKFMFWLPAAVVLALLASLFEALYVLPLHMSEFARVSKKNRTKPHGGTKLLSRFYSGYEGFLRRLLNKRAVFLLVIFLSSALGIQAFFKSKLLRLDPWPSNMIEIFAVNLALPEGNSIQESELAVQEVEKIVNMLSSDELENVVSLVGQKEALTKGQPVFGSRFAEVWVYLTPQSDRAISSEAIVAKVRGELEGVFPADQLSLELLKPGPPAGKAVAFVLKGDDYTVLKNLSLEIQEMLGEHKGVVDIQDNFPIGKREKRVTIDFSAAAQRDVSPDSVVRTIYAAYQGGEATTIREYDAEIPVKTMLSKKWRRDLESLNALLVPNRSGRLIGIDGMASFVDGEGVAALPHYNGGRSVRVSANIAVSDDASRSEDVVASVMEAYSLLGQTHPGYTIEVSGSAEANTEMTRYFFRAFIIALLAIYGLLAVRFDSFLQPFVLMAAIPLTLFGVAITLVLHGSNITIMVMMGLVGLVGIVVNDAIVLVSFINDERKAGSPLLESVVVAARSRIRPILLTSVTTVIGLLPVIYGIGFEFGDTGTYEPFVAPAAMVIGYGLAFATILNLLVVPCLYCVFDDVGRRFFSMFRSSRPDDHASDSKS